MRKSRTVVKQDDSIEAIIFDELWDFDVSLRFLLGLSVEHPIFGSGVVERVIDRYSKVVIRLNGQDTWVTIFIDEMLSQKSAWSYSRAALAAMYKAGGTKRTRIDLDERR